MSKDPMARSEMFDDAALINSLDEVWRSPREIRKRLGTRIWVYTLALELDRLADLDQIDRRSQEIAVPKRSGGNLTIKHYRRRPFQEGA